MTMYGEGAICKYGTQNYSSVAMAKIGYIYDLVSKTVEVEWIFKAGERPQLKEVEGTEKEWKCDLALLALGFTGAEKTLADQFGLTMDFRTNIEATTKDYKTNVPGVFAAGDMRRGQSLIVWAISEGRQAAHHVDLYLMGESHLPLKDDCDLPRV